MRAQTVQERAALPGFKLATEVITRDEELELIALMESCKPLPYPGHEQGGLNAISFGWRYDTASAAFSPCEAAPEGFVFIKDIAARFASLAPADFVQCLLNRYEPGAEISWHCDKLIWEDIVGISLGSQTTMGFRKKLDSGYQYEEVELAPRSIYLMTGDVRRIFDHAIPQVTQTRWSITFRTFSDEGRALRDRFPGCGAPV